MKGLSDSDIDGLSDFLSELMDVREVFGVKPKAEPERLNRMEACLRDGGCVRNPSDKPKNRKVCQRCMEGFYGRMHFD